MHDLSSLGITRPGQIFANLSAPQLVEAALARGEGVLSSTGALVARTGKRTGRSPGDKFVVQRPSAESAERVAWGARGRLPAGPRPVCARRDRRRG